MILFKLKFICSWSYDHKLRFLFNGGCLMNEKGEGFSFLKLNFIYKHLYEWFLFSNPESINCLLSFLFQNYKRELWHHYRCGAFSQANLSVENFIRKNFISYFSVYASKETHFCLFTVCLWCFPRMLHISEGWTWLPYYCPCGRNANVAREEGRGRCRSFEKVPSNVFILISQ